ncbi:putative reverse transcriptase domain-containing protein [Tanacetum coccineum]
MIKVKEMMQDNDLKNSKSKDKGSKSRSQCIDEQSYYKQDKTITRQNINVKRHIFNVIGGTEEFKERDLNIGGDSSGQLVEIDKVIKGCRLELNGHVFDIDLIPFRHGSLDVIIGMDWLSNHRAEIVCHEKVVRIPLLDGKVLKVLGERLEEKVRLLMSTKARDKKQEEIVMVRDFPEVFPNDLFGLPPVWEIDFWIELILV